MKTWILKFPEGLEFSLGLNSIISDRSQVKSSWKFQLCPLIIVLNHMVDSITSIVSINLLLGPIVGA